MALLVVGLEALPNSYCLHCPSHRSDGCQCSGSQDYNKANKRILEHPFRLIELIRITTAAHVEEPAPHDEEDAGESCERSQRLHCRRNVVAIAVTAPDESAMRRRLMGSMSSMAYTSTPERIGCYGDDDVTNDECADNDGETDARPEQCALNGQDALGCPSS